MKYSYSDLKNTEDLFKRAFGICSDTVKILHTTELFLASPNLVNAHASFIELQATIMEATKDLGSMVKRTSIRAAKSKSARNKVEESKVHYLRVFLKTQAEKAEEEFTQEVGRNSQLGPAHQLRFQNNLLEKNRLWELKGRAIRYQTSLTLIERTPHYSWSDYRKIFQAFLTCFQDENSGVPTGQRHCIRVGRIDALKRILSYMKYSELLESEEVASRRKEIKEIKENKPPDGMAVSLATGKPGSS